MTLFVVPPSFRILPFVDYLLPACCQVVRADLSRPGWGDTRPGERALTTANVVETCTLLSRYRLARGIIFLPVGALSAAGASSLYTS